MPNPFTITFRVWRIAMRFPAALSRRVVRLPRHAGAADLDGLDCARWNGQASRGLAERFEKVIVSREGGTHGMRGYKANDRCVPPLSNRTCRFPASGFPSSISRLRCSSYSCRQFVESVVLEEFVIGPLSIFPRPIPQRSKVFVIA